MAQQSIDGARLHRRNFMKALRNAVKVGDLTQYQADELRRGYDK